MTRIKSSITRTRITNKPIQLIVTIVNVNCKRQFLYEGVWDRKKYSLLQLHAGFLLLQMEKHFIVQRFNM
jgi:hypothetical protein